MLIYCWFSDTTKNLLSGHNKMDALQFATRNKTYPRGSINKGVTSMKLLFDERAVVPALWDLLVLRREALLLRDLSGL